MKAEEQSWEILAQSCVQERRPGCDDNSIDDREDGVPRWRNKQQQALEDME